MRKRLLATLLLLVATASATAAATADPAPVGPALDVMLRRQDAIVRRYYLASFLRDHRYDAVLARIAGRLQPYVKAEYGERAGSQSVTYYVFVARLGFNAQTWYRLIIFDSLLLDALHDLARGIAVYGGVDTAYVHELADYVARTHAACLNGTVEPDLSTPENPYHLPAIWGLTPAERDRADALFEEMLAAWLAHEASHAYLNHARDRIETRQLLEQYRGKGRAPAVMRGFLEHARSYGFSREREIEADTHGDRLILRAGYGIEGLVDSLEFSQYLEDLLGLSPEELRSHPSPAERIRLARQLAAQFSAGAAGK